MNHRRLPAAIVVGIAVIMFGPVLVVGGIGTAAISGTAPVATGRDLTAIPPSMLKLYMAAAATCPGLPWTVLAAIGTVESSNGTSTAPGVHSGANSAGAEGPMQFEPGTFAQYDEPVPPGGASPPSPYDAADAVYAAARDLCANGARGGEDLAVAVYAYNHDPAYVTDVLSLAARYATGDPTVVSAEDAGVLAAAWALEQVGTPYRWGGETPGDGFDCSGLVQAAYASVGITLPRTAEEQFDATTPLVAGAPLAVGDLVFFGESDTDVTHVGIYVAITDGETWMVDAPHTGAEVRVEAFPSTVGTAWGDDLVVGFTTPVTSG